MTSLHELLQHREGIKGHDIRAHPQFDIHQFILWRRFGLLEWHGMGAWTPCKSRLAELVNDEGPQRETAYRFKR